MWLISTSFFGVCPDCCVVSVLAPMYSRDLIYDLALLDMICQSTCLQDALQEPEDAFCRYLCVVRQRHWQIRGTIPLTTVWQRVFLGCETERTESDDESGDDDGPAAVQKAVSSQGTPVLTTAAHVFLRKCEGSSPTWPTNTPNGDVCMFHIEV